MNNPEILEIVLIGAGKVAWQLGSCLVENGLKVTEVYNRTPHRGENLANHLGADYVNSLSGINKDANLYVVAVSDDGIEEIVNALKINDQLIVHTSGAVDLAVLQKKFRNCGVFYPLQTFSFEQNVDFTKVPVCIEASSPEGMKMLLSLAHKLTEKVVQIDSNQRKNLHLAAVFACNFSNFMYVIAEEILNDCKLSPELIVPLIRQTSQIVNGYDFFSRQTGPAVRGDIEIMVRHRDLLMNHPDYLKIYNLITNNIIHYKSKHGQL